jgi:hypothetical protein
MTPATRKARQEGKGRKFYAFTDYNGKCHVVNDADRLKMRSPNDSIPDYIPVAVLPLNEQADAARIEAGAKALYRISPLRSEFSQKRIPWGKLSKPWQRNYITQSRVVLRAIGALSTPGKKKKGEGV